MRVFTVSQVTGAIERQLDAAQAKAGGRFWIEGEVSEWKNSGRGDAYISIKDDKALLQCVVWAGIVAKLPPAAQNRIRTATQSLLGLKIQLYGAIRIVPSRGTYRFQADTLKLQDAVGELMLRFREMKSRLEKEGLFARSDPQNPAHRRYPLLVRRIGVVTSKTGAVIHDICSNALARFPNVQIRLYPVKVQGAGAAEEIARGVAYFNNLTVWVPDVLIVGRGGGSIEDLWAFNEEAVVRAVHGSRIPVVSAVGHQTDFTLCDFAADFRAGTPSIAAQNVAPRKIDLADRIRRCEALVNGLFKACWRDRRLRYRHAVERLAAAPAGHLAAIEKRLERVRNSPLHAIQMRIAVLERRLEAAKLRLPGALERKLEETRRRLGALEPRLTRALERKLEVSRRRLEALKPRIKPPMELSLAEARHRLSTAAQKLALLNPFATLRRGYTITFGPDGKVLSSVADVSAGEAIRTVVADGEIVSRVVKP